MSELARTDQKNQLGRFQNGLSKKFMIDPAHNIYFVENDASELAQAKVAGLYITLKNYGIAYDDLDVIYLARAFARHLDVTAARRIGLIPSLPDEKIIQIGNAAIVGASIALLSKTRLDGLEAFVRRIEHVELETDPNSFEYFVIGREYIPVQSDTFGP